MQARGKLVDKYNTIAKSLRENGLRSIRSVGKSITTVPTKELSTSVYPLLGNLKFETLICIIYYCISIFKTFCYFLYYIRIREKCYNRKLLRILDDKALALGPDRKILETHITCKA